MERDFLGAIGHEQLLQHQRAAAEDDATRKEESAYFGGGGVTPMDWSFASRVEATPVVMSFRSVAREEQQGELAFPKQQASRVLTPQRSFGAENHGNVQYAAARAAYGVQSPQQQNAPNGARMLVARSNNHLSG